MDKRLSERTQLDVPTIYQLLSFCLTSTAFQYRGQHNKQLDGVAMGSPVSPIIPNIFMEDLEDKTFATYDATPRVWYRFVDDVISVVKKHNVRGLLLHLNKQHGRIQFTMKMENSGSLHFMDLKTNAYLIIYIIYMNRHFFFQ